MGTRSNDQKLAQRQELPDFLNLCVSFRGMGHHTRDHAEAVVAILEKRSPRDCGN